MNPHGYRNDVIRWRFEALGLSEREIGRAAGLDRETVLRALAGGNLTTLKLKLLCSALNLDRRYVVDDALKRKDFHLAVLS